MNLEFAAETRKVMATVRIARDLPGLFPITHPEFSLEDILAV